MEENEEEMFVLRAKAAMLERLIEAAHVGIDVTISRLAPVNVIKGENRPSPDFVWVHFKRAVDGRTFFNHAVLEYDGRFCVPPLERNIKAIMDGIERVKKEG